VEAHLNLWQRIGEKWDTLPSDAVAEEVKARLMVHCAHAFGFTLVACVGWQLTGGKVWWALGVTLLMFGREALQRIKIKEQWWSCIFDTVQVLLVWPVMFLSDAKWWQAGVSLVAFCVLYVFFLLRDDDWIDE
jgi:hypothetical protein